MFRPTGFADLAGKRVGIFGYGVEGRATAERLGDNATVILVDDAPGRGDHVLVTSEGGHEALLNCDVVVKGPGIPRRREDVLALEAHGVRVTSALNLWLHEIDRRRVIAVTGTKGKSTTTSLITFFLRCLGEPAQSLGNIGQPPYDLHVDTSLGWLVVEVSSYQCVDLELAPATVVVTSLGADHLDWHGSLEQYQSDKLSLTRAAGPHQTFVADVPSLREVAGELGGDVSFVTPAHHELVEALGLLGAHNDDNVSLAVEVVARLTGKTPGEVANSVLVLARDFVPLRGRLTLIASEVRSGGTIRYVDDGLATSELPTIAALQIFRDEAVALIVGGFDRGVDYSSLASVITNRTPPTLLLTMGEAGERIGWAVRALAATLEQVPVHDMSEAVQAAREFLQHGGVVLLSPAAPSFDQFQNWEERSNSFATACFGT